MSSTLASRYAVRPKGKDPLGPFGIYDHIMKAFCGLPDADGRTQELSWPDRIGALSWLHECADKGLSVGHPGLTVRVYKVKDGDRVAKLVRAYWAPAGEPERWPPGLRG